MAHVNSSRGKIAIPAEVVRHFRNLDNIRQLAKASGTRIEVFKARFTDRARYFGESGSTD